MRLFGYTIERNKSKQEQHVPKEIPSEQELDILLKLLEERGLSNFDQSASTVEMPTRAGRSSIPDNVNAFSGNSLSAIPVNYPFHLLPMLENAQVYNRHISYAVENIISLGNTGFEVDYGSNASSKEIQKMKTHLDSVMGGWYEFSDGINSLVVDLMVQACVYGCISAERIPKDNLSGIRKIVRVSPTNVRFSYDSNIDEFIPMQQNVSGGTFSTMGGHNLLNKATYSYIALKRFKNTPYAVAPYFSAIEDLLTEADMLAGFKNMMKRIGMLGFLSVLVQAPKQLTNETPEEFKNRANNYLDEVIPHAEASFNKGIAVGFKGNHEFEVSGNNMNVQGAEGLMSIIKKLVFSGLKQDPSMFGENFSTTESFAKVILSKMSTQVENYQSIVATFLEKCIIQELVLAGFNPNTIKVKFNRPLLFDAQKEIEIENKKFDLYKKEYDQGIINQDIFAQKMGYDKPKEKEPRSTSNEVTTSTNTPNKSTNDLMVELKKNVCEYNYEIPEGCDDSLSLADVTDFGDTFINRKTKSYVNSINEKYASAINKSKAIFRNEISKFDDKTDLSTWQNAMLKSIFIKWEENFGSKIKPVIDSTIEELYYYSRKNDEVFRNAKNFKKVHSFFDIPESALSTLDYRTIEYLKTIDGVWMGKFVTDKDTVKRMNEWMANAFERGELPIGDNMSTQKFLNEFENVVNLESWKIRRIAETTVSKARTYANVNYMNQANVQNFEVVEVMDSKTCRYCSHADGMKMSVEVQLNIIKKVTESDLEDISEITPFATKYKADEFEKLTPEQIQASGVGIPFHCSCRGRLVADL